MEPSFFLSYWRPWNENSSLIDSWGDYLRDTSLVNYGVEKIGEHIKEASREQILSIRQASEQQAAAMERMSQAQALVVRQAAEDIGFKLQNGFSFLNRRLDVSLEQQRLSLMLQKNISELLMIPDSEKERQQAITLGIQFFVNASKDPDLFDDALEEFLKAERMKKQDYFVLHRIGCIYLFTEKHLNPTLAIDYFARAGKYAAVESSSDALRLANILTNPINGDYSQQTSDPEKIKLLAANSYEKAALASYVIGDNENAVAFQEKALKYEDSPQNCFNLAKYLIRLGNTEQAIKQLERSIDKAPEMMGAVFCDADIAGEPQSIVLVDRKRSELENTIEETVLTSFDNKDDFFALCFNDIATMDDGLSYIDKAKILSEFKDGSIFSVINDLKKEKATICAALTRMKGRGELKEGSFNWAISRLSEKYKSVEEYRKSYDVVRSVIPDKYFHKETRAKSDEGGGVVDFSKVDNLFEAAAKIMVISQCGSISDLQSELSIGSVRASHIMDQLYIFGIVDMDHKGIYRAIIPDLHALQPTLDKVMHYSPRH